MPELTLQERLQPSLLDRLTDDDPQRQQESRGERVMSMRQLRESVLRDLGWLLNTSNLTSVHDLTAYPQVAQSVLNYGVPDLTGLTVSSVDVVSPPITIATSASDRASGPVNAASRLLAARSQGDCA